MSSLSSEFPTDLKLGPPIDPNTNAPVDVPSQGSFALEVRIDRLNLLWKLTLALSLVVWWILLLSGGWGDVSPIALILPGLFLAGGSVLTGYLLRHDKFGLAVWVFALGGLAAVVASGWVPGKFGDEMAPFALPLLIFVFGLLVSIRETIVFLVIALAAVILGQTAVEGTLVLTETTLFALLLMVGAAGLSAQVSGELYAIAEWALENYRGQREMTYALLDSREALQKSFLRQQALTKELRRTNEELELARQAAEEAKAFRGQFLANMSHELRTPLNAIIGFSQTMLDFPAMYDGVALPEQYAQDMQQILTSGQHLLSIINDILDLSKVDAGKLDLEIQPIDLAPVVKGVLSTAVGLVGDKKDRIQLLYELPEPLPMVLADPLRVRQVLLNMYSNAAKFTDAGYIKLLVREEDDQVILAVEDTGSGIAEADKASIFEEFRQGTAGRHKGRQGAGLGLAISLQLVRLMNGRLWFESEQGKGSTFFISLPRYVPETADNAADDTVESVAESA